MKQRLAQVCAKVRKLYLDAEVYLECFTLPQALPYMHMVASFPTSVNFNTCAALR